MRVSQQRNADALDLLRKSYNLWREKAEGLMKKGIYKEGDRGGEAEDDDDDDEEVALLIPPYPIRHETAKLFLELGQHNDALPILEFLVMSQDEVPSVWYTYALVHCKLLDYTSAYETLVTAKQLIAKGE